MTKSVKFDTLSSGKGTGPLLETSLNHETHIHVANFLPQVVLHYLTLAETRMRSCWPADFPVNQPGNYLSSYIE